MHYRQLTVQNVSELRQLMEVFAVAFEDQETFSASKPSDDYIKLLLENTLNIVIVAANDSGLVVGGLIAYELKKFEQERGEIYLYDLAVREEYRRQGLATGLIQELIKIGKERGVYEVFVQADNEDTPAVELYNKLSTSKETNITHFNFKV